MKSRARRRRDVRRLRAESLEPRLLLAFDFGDAPLPYPTTLAEDGPRHEATGPMLGADRGSQADGVHAASADGDPGDDGVVFDRLYVGQVSATAAVTVNGAPDGAMFDAWIDFNGDGSFGGPEERIANGTPVVNGANSIRFDIPGWAAEGTTFARFRISTAGHLPVGGAAADGEVEDYAVVILPPGGAQAAFSLPKTIDGAADGAFDVYTADIDSDGDADVVSASFVGNSVAWYENGGSGNFTVHTLSTDAQGARAVSATDLDGDGDTDIVAIFATGGTINWFENDGHQNFTLHTIASVGDNLPYQVSTADIDGDGDVDVLATIAYSGDPKGDIVWYENDGQQVFTPHTIRSNVGRPEFVVAADMDSDGDLDVLASIPLDKKVAWYENDGQGNIGSEHIVSSTALGASGVSAVDMDHDGDLDVVAAASSASELAWYENDGQQGYTEHLVEDNLYGLFSIYPADVDGDGDVDILTATSGYGKIVLYQNDGAQQFTRHYVDFSASGALSVAAADIDGDGDLDVVGAIQNEDTVAWYQNADAFDFGDAPSSYHTTLADGPDGGARSRAGGVRLGATRDFEDDAMAPLDGTGDGADEDGVISTAAAHGATVATQATIQIAEGFGAGRLYGWVDFNGDGDFTDAGEQVADGTGKFAGLADGSVTVGFSIPDSAVTGTTFARFRVSTEAGLGFDGPALDGEVEDYPLQILPPSPASNGSDRYDVNQDQNVNVGDIIDLIRDIRANGFYSVSSAPLPGNPYSDVNGDYQIDIRDILSVIIVIRSGGAAEGETVGAPASSLTGSAGVLSGTTAGALTSGSATFDASASFGSSPSLSTADVASASLQLPAGGLNGLAAAPQVYGSSAQTLVSPKLLHAGAAWISADTANTTPERASPLSDESNYDSRLSPLSRSDDTIDDIAADVAANWLDEAEPANALSPSEYWNLPI